ncbi:hypothetical protein PVK06_019214 [Gossypium arboreum]|uniref:Uncharacterized protein n=1 Tax=Gossypium arboreum TaxID=29729 RepID=A0ABR0PJE0_GOSAR|nr:hypothetical protein PVK06_019214 [Gossypium arboreum]
MKRPINVDDPKTREQGCENPNHAIKPSTKIEKATTKTNDLLAHALVLEHESISEEWTETLIQAAIEQGIFYTTLVEQDSDIDTNLSAVNEFVRNITEPAANPIEENVVVEKPCSELEEDDFCYGFFILCLFLVIHQFLCLRNDYFYFYSVFA